VRKAAHITGIGYATLADADGCGVLAPIDGRVVPAELNIADELVALPHPCANWGSNRRRLAYPSRLVMHTGQTASDRGSAIHPAVRPFERQGFVEGFFQALG
jgi:hypothetical protein